MRNTARTMVNWLTAMAMVAVPGRVLAAAPAAPLVAPNVAAMAEALFEEGKRLYDSKHYSESCPKFAESQRLDPAPGTLLNLANCYEKLGLTASAWATWLAAADAARLAAQPDRDKYARSRAAVLEPRLARLRVSVAKEASTTSLEVKRDGQVLSEATWDVPIPIDPGEHVIEASADGYRTWRHTYVIKDEAGTTDAMVPALTPVPSSDIGGAASEPPPQPSPPAPTPQPASPMYGGATRERGRYATANSPYRTAAYVAGGVGVTGLLTASALGAAAYVKNQSSKAACGDASACDYTGYRQREDALKYARFANISFGIGLVGVATGVLLLVVAPERQSAVARVLTSLPKLDVTPTGAGVSVERPF